MSTTVHTFINNDPTCHKMACGTTGHELVGDDHIVVPSRTFFSLFYARTDGKDPTGRAAAFAADDQYCEECLIARRAADRHALIMVASI